MSLVEKHVSNDSLSTKSLSTPAALTEHDIRRFTSQLEAASPAAQFATVLIDQTPVHLVNESQALAAINGAQRSPRPLAVASINLDHIHHFRTPKSSPVKVATQRVEWLNLIDGAPIASQVERMTATRYPKLSGSDLIGPILDDAAAQGKSIAIVGGSPELAARLQERFVKEWSGVRYAGQWAPKREVLQQESEALALAHELRAADIDIVLVCLGKPRQEDWIESYGDETGASVLLAFGAVVDFLAGEVSRAPQWISNAGMEWAWRLLLEPKRLAKRYLVQGPAAYAAVRRSTLASA